TLSYDSLNRMRTMSLASNEATYLQPGSPSILRNSSYNPFWTTGQYDLTGPDNVTTTTVTDAAYRVTSINRTDTTITLAYDRADRLTSITYASGATVDYTYDNADRVTTIHHKAPGGATLLRLDYGYTPDSLVQTITETDPALGNAVVTFTYDTRS